MITIHKLCFNNQFLILIFCNNGNVGLILLLFSFPFPCFFSTPLHFLFTVSSKRFWCLCGSMCFYSSLNGHSQGRGMVVEQGQTLQRETHCILDGSSGFFVYWMQPVNEVQSIFWFFWFYCVYTFS